MIPGLDVIVAAAFVALGSVCVVGVTVGAVRALRPLAPVTLTDPWRIDVPRAVTALRLRLETHPRRAEVVESGVVIVACRVSRYDDVDPWAGWRLWVGEHQQDYPTPEALLDATRDRLQAIANRREEQRAERALVAK